MNSLPQSAIPPHPHLLDSPPEGPSRSIRISRTAVGWSIFWVCVLLFLVTTAHATLPGSLGLKWGLLLSDFRQMDFDIEEEWPMWHRATAVRLGKRSQTLTGAGSVILVFDDELGLIKTHWASKPIDRDETGAKGMQLFEQLKVTLLKQYGTPQETHEEPSVKLQGFHGDFYQCLQDETCGKWESIWETSEGGVVILELVGLDPGIGFVQMTHQGPNLITALKRAHPGLYSEDHEI